MPSRLADPIATAFVRVAPDLTGFRASLLEQIKAALPAGIPVRISPDLTGFRSNLREQVRTIPPVQIRVTPIGVTEFKRKLEAELAALGGIETPQVPVAASGAARAAVAEKTVAAGATAAAATTAVSGSGTTAAITDEEKIHRQMSVEFAKAEERRRAVAKAATAEISAAFRSEAASLQASTEREIASFNSGEKAAEKASIRQQAAAKARRASLNETAINSFAAAETRLAAVQEAGALKTSEVATLNAKVSTSSAAVSLAKRAETDALLTNNQALIGNARALLATAEAEKVAQIQALLTARAQVDQAKASSASAASSATVARGAGATALSFAGLRGATLAASGTFLAGAAAAAIFAKSIFAFASFETTLNTFQAVTGATADQMERVSVAAQKLGNDITLPAVSASDAATAFSELAKAGLSVNQAIAAGRGVLQLATAANIENAQAVELVATALNAFNLAGRDAVHVADVLANAANAAQGSISDFGVALGQSAAVANQVGVSLDDTISLLALFARNGLRGSDAGTSLRTAFIKLIAPTKQADAVIAALGLHIRDAQSNIRPDIFAQFGEATSQLTPELRDTFAEIIAGTDAIRAFAIGAREGTQGLRDIQDQIARQGTAAEVAAARTKGLSGEAEAFKNSAATLAITIGRGLAPAIESIVQAANKAVNSLGDIAHVIGTITRPIGPLGHALGEVAKAFGAGIIPVLAIVGVYKAYTAIAGVVTAAQAKLTASNLTLAASKGVLAAADEAASAAAIQAGTAQAAAGAAAAGRGGSALALAGSLRALVNPYVLATAAAVALGGALVLLSRHESDTKKATDDLIDSLRELAIARTPRNLVEVRQNLEKLEETVVSARESFRQGFTRATSQELEKLQDQSDRTGKAIVALRDILAKPGVPETSRNAITQELDRLVETKTGLDAAIQGIHKETSPSTVTTRSTEDFVNNIKKTIEALGDQDPVIRHNLLLLRDFINVVGHIPTQKEFKFIINNDATKTSLADLVKTFSTQGGQTAIDAEKLGEFVSEQISIGIARGPTTNPNLISPLFAAAQKAQAAFGLGKIIPTLDASERDKALNSFKALINQLAALGEPGQIQLRALGQKLGAAFAQGISDEDKAAIAAANQSIQDAIVAGEKQVNDAVNQAKSNLGSISQSLAGSVGQVLDARAQSAIAALDKSKLGSEITALQKELDKSNVASQRSQLSFNLLSATDAASQKQARFALQQFDLSTQLDIDKKKIQSQKETIQKTADAQKTAITRNLAAYADSFAKGEITLQEFQAKVLATLHKAIPDFKTVGTSLGTAFRSTFDAQLGGLLDQALALLGTRARTPGGTTQVGVTRPEDAIRESRRAIQDAKDARDKLVKGSGDQVRLLDLIEKHTRPKTSPHNRNTPPTDPFNPIRRAKNRSKVKPS